MEPKSIAERIAARRKLLGLKQKDVAAQVGVSRVAVTKWENEDIRDIRYVHLQALSVCLNCSVSWLVAGEDGSQKIGTKISGDTFEGGAVLTASDLELVRQGISCLDAFLTTRPSSIDLVQAAHSLLRQVVPQKY